MIFRKGVTCTCTHILFFLGGGEKGFVFFTNRSLCHIRKTTGSWTLHHHRRHRSQWRRLYPHRILLKTRQTSHRTEYVQNLHQRPAYALCGCHCGVDDRKKKNERHKCERLYKIYILTYKRHVPACDNIKIATMINFTYYILVILAFL